MNIYIYNKVLKTQKQTLNENMDMEKNYKWLDYRKNYAVAQTAVWNGMLMRLVNFEIQY